MADSKKSTVVIASVLKPVDDPRMFEKIGLTLAASGEYDVHLIGRTSPAKQHGPVTQHPLGNFSRFSPGRFVAPWRIFLITVKLKPDILIISTHELLYLAMVLKLFTKCKVLYDVQENYYWNILYTPAFPLLVKPFIAFYVRGKEVLCSKFIDHFLLAEKGYEQELKFPGNRYTVIENKVQIPPGENDLAKPLVPGETVELIFSGTIAETTGVFTAIELAVKLHVIDERFRLTIIGFCSQPGTLEKIRLLIKPRSFIRLVVRDTPIPHPEIFAQIRKSHFGLITYQINPSTMNSIPTKMYEYLGFKLPILLVNHKPWVDFCLPLTASVVFDAANVNGPVIYSEMMNKSFYTALPDFVYWETEEPKLLEAVGRLR